MQARAHLAEALSEEASALLLKLEAYVRSACGTDVLFIGVAAERLSPCANVSSIKVA